MKKEERNGWQVEEGRERYGMKNIPHQPQNVVAFDLSSSNPNSQYSVTQHGLTSDNTLTNLLMYESEYVPMIRRDMLGQKDKRHAIHENSRESEPTYYHDNTQDQQYESSQEESEDVLINFLDKMKESFDYRIRMVMRSTFQQLYMFASRSGGENHAPVEVSEVGEVEMEGKSTQVGSSSANLFNFNSNIKRKAGLVPLLSTNPAKLVNKSNGKSVSTNIQLDDCAFQARIYQEETLKPPKPIIRLLPDSMREESFDEVGIWDQLDPISFQTSNQSPDPEYQMLDCMNKDHAMRSGLEQPPIQMIQRPSSLYVRGEHRPLGPTNLQPIIRNRDSFDDYGGMGMQSLHRAKQHSPVVMVRPEIKAPVFQPRQKVNITYNNTGHDRSHSQFSKHPPRIQNPSPQPIHRQRVIRQQIPDNQINMIRSQYYNVQHREPERVIERIDSIKRINSTPTSPVLRRIVKEGPKVGDVRMGAIQSKQRPLSPNGIGLVSNSITGMNSPMDTTPNMINSQHKTKQPSSEYYQFTRPSKHENQSTKSKSKKISIVSNRSGCNSTINNN